MTLTLTQAPAIIKLPGIVIPEEGRRIARRIDDGNYRYRADAIEKLFRLTLSPGPCPLFAARADEDAVAMQNVREWALDKGWSIAPIDCLLAVGSHEEYGKLQQQHHVVCLQTSNVVDGDSRLAYLYKDPGCGGRCLHLAPYGQKLGPLCYFLFHELGS